nr:type II toxin-antitoxin system death-on-curing family toxin [uncultured Arsenicibacter sp.]
MQVRYLTKEQIIKLNQATIQAHGGNFMPPNNFLHEENLDYLLDAVQADMFGVPLYPTITDKAALLCHSIICNHIFSDGNKRTGLGAALIFLNLNGYSMAPSVDDALLTDFIIRVASGLVDLDTCRAWFTRYAVTNQPY